MIRADNNGINPYCMHELTKMLATFVVVMQVFGLVFGFLVPWCFAKAKAMFEYWWLRHMVDLEDEGNGNGNGGGSRGGGKGGGWQPLSEVESGGGRPRRLSREEKRRTNATNWCMFALRLLRAIALPCCGGNTDVPRMSVYEEQAKLMRFDEPTGLSGVIPKYVSLLIQIGYIVLFAPAFPFAAIICLLSNIWRIRADACLLLYNTQRPPFRCAQDIGTLQQALRVLSLLAVATHVGLLVFTSTQLHSILPLHIPWLNVTVNANDKFTLLIILEHLLLGGQYVLNQLLEVFLPTLPKQTSIWKAVERRVDLLREGADREEAEATSKQARGRWSMLSPTGKAPGPSPGEAVSADL